MSCEECGFFCCDISREDCPVCGTNYEMMQEEKQNREELGKIIAKENRESLDFDFSMNY